MCFLSAIPRFLLNFSVPIVRKPYDSDHIRRAMATLLAASSRLFA